MASITKYKDGYRVQVYVKGIRKSNTFRKRADAVKWGRDTEAELQGRTGRDMTLGDALARFSDEITPTRSSGQSRKRERQRLAWLEQFIPDLCAKRLVDITKHDIQAFIEKRTKTVQPQTAQQDVILLQAVWREARNRWGIDTGNPFRGRQRANSPVRDRVYDWREIRRIVRELRAHKSRHGIGSRAAAVFLLSIASGARSGEIVQFNARTVTLHRDGTGVAVLAEHKTSKVTGKPRIIPLSRRAVRILKPWLPDGIGISQKDASDTFREACRRLSIGGAVLHDARATGLTLMSRKVDVLTLARVAGHTDTRMLATRYYRESAADIAKRL